MSRNLVCLGQCFISCVYHGAQHLVKALKVLVELLNQSVKKFRQKPLLYVVLNHIESYMVCVCMCICVMVICAGPWIILGFPGGTSGKKPACQCRRYKRGRFEAWVGNIPREGNGNPLQYSCLENPMDGGAWWATVHGVTQSWTRLKWLSTHTPGLYTCWQGYDPTVTRMMTYDGWNHLLSGKHLIPVFCFPCVFKDLCSNRLYYRLVVS